MKNIILLATNALILLVFATCSEPEVTLDQERPDNIIPTTVRSETLQNIKNMFPEQKNTQESLPELFEVTAEKRIILSRTSEVYVTFVSEGASFQNSFGYYTYNKNSIPTDTSMLDLHILFPNVDGWKLKQGDMLQVGNSTFPAGTVIGFFLIVKGWESQTVHYDREKIFTDIGFNTLGDQQHILFKLKNFGDIILSFEDILDSAPGYHDYDFNDIIFTVSDNRNNREVSNFNHDNVVKL
ncbi:MAG: DUF4114 domain-containing protein [Cyclobacteriaceae bacterium]